MEIFVGKLLGVSLNKYALLYIGLLLLTYLSKYIEESLWRRMERRWKSVEKFSPMRTTGSRSMNPLLLYLQIFTLLSRICA